MKVTLIHPCIGKHLGQKEYIRTWQMEPLGAATLASLTPSDHTVKFYDDRLESIPFSEKTDLVAISIETYTAKRAYQIASEYRRRNVPVSWVVFMLLSVLKKSANTQNPLWWGKRKQAGNRC